ncbi:hypothetical protein J437_LFUL007316 [Ladona fulva]|uniref:Reverse transcriptase domain-containing protein n=1 Tax=Ladona fulva TaxID=123851 RepID=A0A8K0K5U4_LADFU|nr:hypothetical protein J437_LFUL007316 [Ladona fulva]
MSRTIKIGVRQGDGLSPSLFNCTLEKVIREWRESLKVNQLHDRIKPDDLVILFDSIGTAVKQIENLKEQAKKTGLQISFEKTKYMTNVKTAPKKTKAKYG